MGIGTLNGVESRPVQFEGGEGADGGITPSILAAIGWTPLIPLRRVAAGLKSRVLAKVESLNPGGSIKDRVGVAMVEEAERRGWLRPAARSSRRPRAIPGSGWRWRPRSRAIGASSCCPTR